MSVRANELRIGNYVSCFGGIERITMIGEFGVQCKTKTSCANCKFTNPTLQPITLTEETFLKYGFTKEECFYIKDGVCIMDDEGFSLDGFGEIPLEFEHQLQNLYFCLKGKELQENF